jgi:hypothetical protein
MAALTRKGGGSNSSELNPSDWALQTRKSSLLLLFVVVVFVDDIVDALLCADEEEDDSLMALMNNKQLKKKRPVPLLLRFALFCFVLFLLLAAVLFLPASALARAEDNTQLIN